ncbi:glycosyltransferase family 2 protein [Ornithinimicrobium faecis]|uniref:glycosyltransferase family 2 protein n=1 Tax=Ornithinimicrobium faecis TaxID=2934158 RepID=UPI002118E69D|nr:glycosyltransferase family 2 protein [Ornithinimicrobium sp. HY1745]
MGAHSNSDLIASLAEGLPADKIEPYTAFALRTRSPLAPAVLRAAGHEAAAARLVALSGAPDAHQRGLELLDRIVTQEGVAAQSPEVATLYAQLLVRTDRSAELAALLDDPQTPLKKLDRWSLRTDLLNPHRAGAPDTPPEHLLETEDRWLTVLNEIHEADGLEPVRLRPPGTGENPYQRLAAPTSERVDGELVTVVMSAFRPDRDLLLAVRGVLEQTWQNLELLIVDDASPAGADDLLEEAASLDPRVQVVRAPRNGGTYQARNLALTIATGRWMTFQDSDDWTHPRRVELQVRHLLENPSLLANRTWTLRAYEDLALTYVGYSAARLNASSLLFDRVPVQALLGQFDAVRKSGDMELPFRLKALREGSVRDLRHPAPLAITQLRSNSLSRADAVPGWLRWDRLAYRDSYMEWHDQVRATRLDARLPGHRTAPRPFPLPRAGWAPDRPAQPQTPHWQVVVMGDLRTGQPRAPRTMGVARVSSDAGLTTAVANTESPKPIARKREAASRALSHDTRIGRIGLTNAHEDDRVDLLVVTDPASLLHLDAATLDVGEILVLADEAEPTGWSVAAVDDRCLELFGRLPRWGGPARVHDLPDGPSPARAEVTGDRWVDADLALVTGADWPHVPTTARGRAVEDPLIIGHHLRDYVARWPKGPKALRRAYPLKPVITGDDTELPVEVHTLGGLTVPSQLLNRELPPPTWLSFLGTGMTLREFLSHLDVWVYQGTWDLHAEIATLEALAAGLPCVLPEAAAVSDLQGRVRCVAPADAVDAALDLVATAHDSANSARSRADAWGQTLRSLVDRARVAVAVDAPEAS